ncbi:HlyD family type I secretion periplasmic adaptor subunit [Xenophilus arseniciresistens]|uniref:Membrane fusion protein (MFP) family protein n=1 Tax=Xenophilus arseniciresistens TaxID=1283306 RepID=A0AAE3NB88_9BURK|nr:HlyD family type I secretion periplasmic adaptor subunit [Xenophilus arseniciresistens]MDA7418163.1 HlyD family type I secretion periplasmic adaptor subunit [Xenophilus arseniciresistens]
MKNDLPQILQQLQDQQGQPPPPAPGGSGAPSPRRRRWLLGAVVGALALVALGFPMESVVVATGRVIPSDRVKSIQHLEGGIVRSVMVREGQPVRQGAPLVEIDLGGSSLNLEELTARHAAQQATRVRLRAESLGQPLSSGQFETGTDEAVVRGEMGAYEARALEQRGVMAGTVAGLEQARGRQMEQHAKISGLTERLALMQTELKISEQLLSEKLIGQMEVLEKRRQAEGVRAELAVARQGLVSATAAIGEAQAKMAEAEGRFRRRASDELAALERQLASLNEDLARARTQRSRTVVTAPSDGIVKGLRSASPGWVVKPGEAIMEVVPVEDEILVEARLSPNDRGFVHVGQKARVKVTAYDFLRYGTVDGKVMLVAADADRDTTLPTAPPYYRLLVNTAQAHVGRPENRITAGMEAEVDLIVGTDPFIWYLLRPVLKTQREAFREP